jgi:hypothetical protein
MKKDALCVNGKIFLVTMIRSLCLSMSPGTQKDKRYSRPVHQVLLTVACMCLMNLGFSQPIVKIVGSTDSVAILKQVALYLEYLDIRENIRLAVIFSRTMPENYVGITTCINGEGLKKGIGYLNIKVYLDGRRPKFLQTIVLAHEMIHVKQYAKAELIINSRRQVIWKGQKYSSHNAEHGDPRPWEREAYRNDIRLVKYWKEQSEIPLPISTTDAYVDHELKQKQISDFQQKY